MHKTRLRRTPPKKLFSKHILEPRVNFLYSFVSYWFTRHCLIKCTTKMSNLGVLLNIYTLVGDLLCDLLCKDHIINVSTFVTYLVYHFKVLVILLIIILDVQKDITFIMHYNVLHYHHVPKHQPNMFG